AEGSSKSERDKFNARVRAIIKDRDEAVVVSAKLAEQLRLLQQSEWALKARLGGELKLSKELEDKLKASGIRIVSLEADAKKSAAELEKEKKRAGRVS